MTDTDYDWRADAIACWLLALAEINARLVRESKAPSPDEEADRRWLEDNKRKGNDAALASHRNQAPA